MEKSKKYKGIYQDKNGTYYVSTTFITQDGFEVKKCKRGFKSQREANAWKEEQRVFFSKNNYSVTGAVKTPTECLVDRYLQYRSKSLKKTTIQNITLSLYNHFVTFFKDMILNDLKPQDIQDYYCYIADSKMKNQSKNDVISNVLCFIEWLDVMELISPSITRKFKLILQKFEVVEQSKHSFLNPDEVEMLLSSFGEDESEKLGKLMITAFCYSGLRKSEMRALTYADIDYVNNTISVSKQRQHLCEGDIIVNFTKTNRNKVVDIPLFLTMMFKKHQDEKNALDTDFIFKLNNRVVSYEYANETLHRHLKKCGLPDCKVHDLRHTYASYLLANGFSDKYVAEQLGHSSPNTTHAIYEHVLRDKEKTFKSRIDTLVM